MLNLEKHNSKRVNGYSSKGNVPKWLIGDNWYKIDVFGYEGLAEYMVSHLLKKTNVKKFVLYDLSKVIYQGEKIACVSKNFIDKDEEIVTIERLHLAEKGIGLNAELSKIKNVESKIKYTVDFIENITGIKDFHIYLTMMLEIDMLFLNEDRHTNNIALIKSDKKYKVAPLFDNGLSILSDTNDYKMEEDIYKNIDKVKAKPFCMDFIEQVEAIEKIYNQRFFISFNKKDVDDCLLEVKKYYPIDVIERVRTILYEQLRKYEYLKKR